MTVLIGFLICRPVQKNWDPTSPGVCGDRIAGYTAVSVVNVIVDILMLVLPLPMVFRLQVKQGYKVGLFSIFGIGIVTVVFSVVRLRSLKSIDFDDFSWTVVPVMTWTTAENAVLIMVASSALLRPVFDKLFGRLLSLTSKSRLGGTGDRYPYGQDSRSGLGLGSRKRKEFISVNDGDGNAVSTALFHLLYALNVRSETDHLLTDASPFTVGRLSRTGERWPENRNHCRYEKQPR